MKNVFGEAITYTLFGESHGPCTGITVDGLAPGMEIDLDYINKMMQLRKASGNISTARKEDDELEFLSGVRNGFSEGTPLTIIIRNNNVRSQDYSKMSHIARPGHADFTAQKKYLGFQDPDGGGHFSGRLTAPIVAAGSIVRLALEKKGIFIGSHIKSLHGINDVEMNYTAEEIKELNDRKFAVIDEEIGERMKNEILKARENHDSVGGILETAVVGLPAGIGEPFFSSLESVIAGAVFSIGGVKGIEFGSGFDLANMFGSEANDPFRIEDGKVVTATNHMGGINGGISNGMPVVFNTVIKPTSSIGIRQETVDFQKMENTELELGGRHDPAIIHRARVVIDSITAMAIAELLVQRYGYLYLGDQV